MLKSNDAAFTAQYRLTDTITAQTQFDRNLDGDSHTSVTQTLNRDLEHYRLSLSSQVDDRMQYTVGLSLVFSIARDEATDTLTAIADPRRCAVADGLRN